ncbi:MAG: penicillin-binding protein 2 [Candidatus Omnitrophota bacterium]|nr:penicillin-binding protein 2 [Candidatus Omnitrophota bacterium]
MRINKFSTAVSICFLSLVMALGYSQIIRRSYYRQLSENNRIRLLPQSARRGVIYDRNNKVLAADRLSFNLCIIPRELRSQTISRLNKILGFSRKEIKKILKKNTVTPFAPVVIIRDIDYSLVAAVEERSTDLPGAVIQTCPLRHYPHRKSGAHVIGYLGKIRPDELEARKRYGYQFRDLVGRDGLERSFDVFLKGTDGGQLAEIDSRGRIQRILSRKPPLKGNDLYLTLDLDLTKLARDLLKDNPGVIIVMDSATGGILTMVSSPAYNPNLFVDPQKSGQRLKILRDKSYPLLNRAIGSQYPPGSIFKIVTALVALETKKISSSSRKFCNGKYKSGRRTFRCWKKDGHGSLNLEEAITYSCNVFFYHAGLKVGADGLARFARYLGLGCRTGIELPGEIKGIVPDRKWKKSVYNKPWYEGETLNLSIGQGYISISPLQAVRMVSAVANRGILSQPHLVKSSPLAKRGRKLNISEGNFNVVRRGMFKGVSQERGTSHRAYLPGVSIAAKTGTAQATRGKSHSWFLGFCPLNGQNISFVVFLEHGGYASQRAAEIAGKLIKGWKEISQNGA